MLIQFATQSYKSRSLPLSAQRLVNCYSEREPSDAKSPIALFGAPGLVSWTTAGAGAGPIRGMHVMGDFLYVVSGDTLYSVTSAGVATAVGSTVSGTGVVSMADNGTQLCIVNGVNGYIYTVTGGFQIITDVNFHSANTVTFFDSYFVFDWKGTNKYFISNILDGTTFGGLDFATAEVQSDYVIATVNQQENLLIFGTRTIETWYDAGALSFPFQRYDGATIERGCSAPLTPIKEDNSVFFLGDELIFYRLNGIVPVRISTHAIEAAWRQYQVISDAYTCSYTFEGHKFIVLTFPSQPVTWVYDISTNLWHERISWDQNNNTLERWRGNCFANFNNMLLIGDTYNGTIGYLDANTFTEYGNTMQAVMVSPPIHSDRKRVYVSSLELDMETGTGLSTGQGAEPQIMLDWSNDGGRTWVALQKWTTLGKVGEYLTRVRWTRLGQARARIFRVFISDPVKRVVIAAHADISVGM